MAQQGQKVADKQEQIRTTGKMTPRDDWSWVIRSFCFTPCCMSNQHLEKNVIGNIQILSCSRILSSKGLCFCINVLWWGLQDYFLIFLNVFGINSRNWWWRMKVLRIKRIKWQRIVYYYFNNLIALFKQKQFPSAYILAFVVGLSLKTKECFTFSVLFLFMHYATGNNHSFLCIIGIVYAIGTKVFKLQNWFSKIFLLYADCNLHHFL